MNNILKTLIDYSLFEKYDKEYFIKNKYFIKNLYLQIDIDNMNAYSRSESD